ncbi:MAG TPA: HNH endonuclease signature motif containing protein, partial [Streptosporangiaceae bacterium]
GQPTQVLLHLTLAQLRGTPGGSAAEDAWAAARASQPGWLTGPDADAALCDATVVPVVTGHVDWAALDRLTDTFLLTRGIGRHTGPGEPAGPGGPGQHDGLGGGHPCGNADPGQPGSTGQPSWPGHHGGSSRTGSLRPGQPSGPAPAPLSPATRDRLRRALLGLAADTLSGPEGLAARLRAALDGKPLTTLSLPLDIGAATDTIPAHLRRAVTTRHACCAFPGCDQPTTVCDIHHIVPRSRGGPTSLPNLVPLCTFHHLTAIHRWGWSLALHPDAATTATSPDRTRTLHSHGPPRYSPPGHPPPGHDPPSRAA